MKKAIWPSGRGGEGGKNQPQINPLLPKPHDGGWNVAFGIKQHCVPISDVLQRALIFSPCSLTSLSFCLFIN